jgi:hypothetical protein
MGKKNKVPDHISESLETICWDKKILKFFAVDPYPESFLAWIRDPG